MALFLHSHVIHVYVVYVMFGGKWDFSGFLLLSNDMFFVGCVTVLSIWTLFEYVGIISREKASVSKRSTYISSMHTKHLFSDVLLLGFFFVINILTITLTIQYPQMKIKHWGREKRILKIIKLRIPLDAFGSYKVHEIIDIATCMWCQISCGN